MTKLTTKARKQISEGRTKVRSYSCSGNASGSSIGSCFGMVRNGAFGEQVHRWDVGSGIKATQQASEDHRYTRYVQLRSARSSDIYDKEPVGFFLYH